MLIRTLQKHETQFPVTSPCFDSDTRAHSCYIYNNDTYITLEKVHCSVMSDSEDSADIVDRVRGTVESVTDEAEDVGAEAQEEISEALDELEQHVKNLRDRE